MVKHATGVVTALFIVTACLAGELKSVGNQSKVVNKPVTASISPAPRQKQAGVRGKSAAPASGTDQSVRWVNGRPVPWPWDAMPYRVTRPRDGC